MNSEYKRLDTYDDMGGETNVIVHIANDGDLKMALNSMSKAPYTIIKIGLPNCTPCVKIQPTFQALAAKHKKICRFYSAIIKKGSGANLDAWTDSLKLESAPTFLFFQKDKEVGGLRLASSNPKLLLLQTSMFLSKNHLK